MQSISINRLLATLTALALVTASLPIIVQAHAAPAAVDENRLTAAESEPGEWMSTGRTYGEQHYSPLDSINAGNIGGLHLAGYYDIPTHYGQEATPLVVDGVMYVSTDQSIVKALDPTTGHLLWSFDPAATSAIAKNCCAGANRGVAVWKGKVFVGALDGRLIALDAATGKVVWQTVTVDQSRAYTISGAPRIVKGKVLIGNGGSELGGSRGYVSAYDAETGKLAWRFYLVPGEPGTVDHAVSDRVLKEKALKTWSGKWWVRGGGGNPWDSMSYDPKLDLLYIGTGNGAPWNHTLRSAGKGDNLFVASIVALRPDTGEYVWHYQMNPGESWDFTSTQNMVLADLKIGGVMRQVLMQAPKNGFFYVLDRKTGELLSAKPIVDVTWAKGIDMHTGRPIENPDARYDHTGKPFLMNPSGLGAHNWQPMSYSPQTGLVYIPVQQMPMNYVPNMKDQPTALKMYVGAGFTFGTNGAIPNAGWLAAWDPVQGKEVWRVPHVTPWNGGTLVTKGNLVFQGDDQGMLSAYAADSGHQLWTFQAQTGVVAAPISYTVNGEQYVAVMAGWGGTFTTIGGGMGGTPGPNRLLIFKIGGKADLPPKEEVVRTLDPPPSTASAETIAKGEEVYGTYCLRCHGAGAIGGGVLPDLRYSSHLGGDSWFDIVLGGALAPNGMASFAPAFDHATADTIRAYIVKQANDLKQGKRPDHAPAAVTQ